MFTETLIKIGFVQNKADPCLFKLEEGQEHMMMAIVVDDTISYSTCPKLYKEVIDRLKTELDFKDLGVCKWFLGCRITQTRNGTLVDQDAYLGDAGEIPVN